jgi:hypothetical protein
LQADFLEGSAFRQPVPVVWASVGQSGDRSELDLLPADGRIGATATIVQWTGANGLFDLMTGNLVGKSEVSFTLNGAGTNADGSTFRFHSNGHTVTDAARLTKVAFVKAKCS